MNDTTSNTMTIARTLSGKEITEKGDLIGWEVVWKDKHGRTREEFSARNRSHSLNDITTAIDNFNKTLRKGNSKRVIIAIWETCKSVTYTKLDKETWK